MGGRTIRLGRERIEIWSAANEEKKETNLGGRRHSIEEDHHHRVIELGFLFCLIKNDKKWLLVRQQQLASPFPQFNASFDFAHRLPRIQSEHVQ